MDLEDVPLDIIRDYALKWKRERDEAIRLLTQRLKDLKAIEKTGIINKKIFRGFDHAIEETEEFLIEIINNQDKR